MSWFTVPGQNCPVALGSYECEYDADCEAHLQALAKENPACAQLVGPDTGLGWTDAGAIQNSSAGSLRCGIRKVCEMKENFSEARITNAYLWIGIATIIIGVAIYSLISGKMMKQLGIIIVIIGIIFIFFSILNENNSS